MIRRILNRKMVLSLLRLPLWRAMGWMVMVMITVIALSAMPCALELGMLWGMDGIRGESPARGNHSNSTDNSAGIILISVVAVIVVLLVFRNIKRNNGNRKSTSYRLLLATAGTDSVFSVPAPTNSEDEEWGTGGGHPLRAPKRNESNGGEYLSRMHAPSTNRLARTTTMKMTMKMKMTMTVTNPNTDALVDGETETDGGERTKKGSSLTAVVPPRCHNRHRYRQVAKAAAARAATCRRPPHPKTTQIHWNEKVHVKVVQNHHQYTLQEKRNSWYSADEYTRMHQACRCSCRTTSSSNNKNHRGVERNIRLVIMDMLLRNHRIDKDEEVDEDPTCSIQKHTDSQSLWGRRYFLP